MMTASELFLVRLRYSLVIGGMMTRSACGKTTRRMRCPGRSPNAIAASLCPQLTARMPARTIRSEEHTSELQSHVNLVCRLLLEKKNKKNNERQTQYNNHISMSIDES